MPTVETVDGYNVDENGRVQSRVSLGYDFPQEYPPSELWSVPEYETNMATDSVETVSVGNPWGSMEITDNPRFRVRQRTATEIQAQMNDYARMQVNAMDMVNFAGNIYKQPALEVVKPYKLMPSKVSKLKEWSISSRALKRVILGACHGRDRYDYKFGSVGDNRYKISRIWNVKTNNVVCTVKRTQNGKVIIRYRQSSFYSPMLAGLNGIVDNDLKIIAIASEKLGIHRGVSEHATRHLSATPEAQLGVRQAMYDEAMYRKAQEATEAIRQLQKKGKR